MKDINGIEIKHGDPVKTMQPSGGILPPSEPVIGNVEIFYNGLGEKQYLIKYRTKGRNFDQIINIENQINQIIKN